MTIWPRRQFAISVKKRPRSVAHKMHEMTMPDDTAQGLDDSHGCSEGLWSVRRMKRQGQDEFAREYGFTSYAELRAASTPLCLLSDRGDEWFVTRDARGRWFVWHDEWQRSTAEALAESPTET
jgi:hypothetical protein